MSDFEKINSNVKVQMSARRKDATKRIVVVLLKLLLALGAIVGLNAIGFISNMFMVILVAVAVCVGAFKTGYIWRDIKF